MRHLSVATAMILATITCAALSPWGLAGPQKVSLKYAARGPIPDLSLNIIQSPISGRIESIELAIGECHLVVPDRYYRDIAMPFLAEAGLHLGFDEKGALQISIEFGAFLADKNGVLMLQKVMIEVENERVTLRQFQMQEDGKLWYEER